jgi:hypothetical protein
MNLRSFLSPVEDEDFVDLGVLQGGKHSSSGAPCASSIVSSNASLDGEKCSSYDSAGNDHTVSKVPVSSNVPKIGRFLEAAIASAEPRSAAASVVGDDGLLHGH